MGIGKKSKSFDQIDFDREDFGMNDDAEDEEPENEPEEGFDNDIEAEEKAFVEKQLEESSKSKNEKKNNDLFDQDVEAEEKDDLAGKSSYEIRQIKVIINYWHQWCISFVFESLLISERSLLIL